MKQVIEQIQQIIGFEKKERTLQDYRSKNSSIEEYNYNLQPQLLPVSPLHKDKLMILPSMIKETEFRIECTKENINIYAKRSITDFFAKQDGAYNIVYYPLLYAIKTKPSKVIHGRILSYEKREFPLFEEQGLDEDIEVALGLKKKEEKPIGGFVDPVVYILTQNNKIEEGIIGAEYANLFICGRKSLDEIKEKGKSDDFFKPFVKSRGFNPYLVHRIKYDPYQSKRSSFKFNLSYFEGNYEEKSEAELEAFLKAHIKLSKPLFFIGERKNNKFIIDCLFDQSGNNFFNAYLFDKDVKLKSGN